MIEDFVNMQRGQTFDAFKLAQAIKKRWGVKIDWHETSAVLDHLSRTDQAVIVKRGYVYIYRIL
jgi:hypothetical protein